MKTKNKTQSTSNDKNLTRDIVVTYLALLTLLLTAPATPAHADINNYITERNGHGQLPKLIAVGRGELTWFGIPIYEASLWTQSGEFRSLSNTLPLAFTITYERNITSAALAKRTIKEWEHLGKFDSETRNFWGSQLERIWPNVKPGDSITTLVTSDSKTHFYHNEKLLTVLEDPTFGTALLAIWLDANTSEPGLRAKLIGKKEHGND